MDHKTLHEIIVYYLRECELHERPWCELKQDFHSAEEIGRNISAIANICRVLNKTEGFIIFGVESITHNPTGTNFNPWIQKGKGEADLIPWLTRQLSKHAQFEFIESIDFLGQFRMILCIVKASQGSPVLFEGMGYIRVDTYTQTLKENKGLEKKLWESLLGASFDTDIAKSNLTGESTLDLVNWKGYCDTMKYEPVTPIIALEKLEQDKLILKHEGLFDITNACALLFANNLDNFGLKSKSPRVIIYRGINNLHSINDIKGEKGFAIAFSGLINYVISQVPKLETIETTRTNDALYPRVTLREFIANAIIHQDFRATGSEVLIEIYDDRIEISNPGIPLIEIDRFLDHPPKSRNEIIADFMRRAGHCEKRGSGIDRALAALQLEKLPNPKIERSDDFTKIILYRFKPIGRLTNAEKAQAIYWHCVLLYILNNEPMTNDSVCERFTIEKQNSSIASRLIKLSVESGKIKPFDPSSKTRKHRKYIPFWVS